MQVGDVSLLALLDTGASFSCIAESKAKDLDLKEMPTKFELIGSSGVCEMPIYKLDKEIVLPNSMRVTLPEIKTFKKALEGEADFILGMDVIGKGFLSVQFDRRILFGI